MARTGRPREFDRDKAVEAAMTLFWSQGYEPTSLGQLKACMGGISPASFYAAFGSKEGLFREVVERYLQTYGRVTDSLHDLSLPPRKAIETALRRSAKMQTEKSHPPGCFIILGASNCSPENLHVEELLPAERMRNRQGIKDCVRRAVANGELASSTDVDALATVFDAFFVGSAVEARDGTRTRKLDAAITQLMRFWDSHIAVA
ncbi:TetR/AcrR family transcriptional regulator [Gluconobacter kondonii]|uniref:TetR/AcrR family transcriptional regulator n=1 Tax=Gluconobacter kondonii TaxID=941463 RepID=UPI001B8C4F8E|nr:TetR/AcrR family transcriptional regulator [Gluconobacter kondonii]MBS1081250.1 TetR/AcrR family transcriptional regulator [Gluconobacter kondonii]